MNVLLVEDDPRIADFLMRGLRAEGYQVQRAATGPQGLEMAQLILRDENQREQTILILDLMLPGMDGLQICQTLRAGGLQMPILMLTAMTSLEERVQGLRMGADDYLCKPFEFEELLARLEALGRRARTLQPTRTHLLQVADLILDRDSMRASRAGQALNLTARELAVLELLMSAPGRLFSRERILATVWGQNEDPLTNVVDVYIRRLRAKVDDYHPTTLIQTVRGLGYRLEPVAT